MAVSTGLAFNGKALSQKNKGFKAKSRNTRTWEECADKCLSMATCAAFSWVVDVTQLALDSGECTVFARSIMASMQTSINYLTTSGAKIENNSSAIMSHWWSLASELPRTCEVSLEETCRFFPERNVKGHDLFHYKQGLDEEGCCALCASDPACNSWTLTIRLGSCFLKTVSIHSFDSAYLEDCVSCVSGAVTRRVCPEDPSALLAQLRMAASIQQKKAQESLCSPKNNLSSRIAIINLAVMKASSTSLQYALCAVDGVRRCDFHPIMCRTGMVRLEQMSYFKKHFTGSCNFWHSHGDYSIIESSRAQAVDNLFTSTMLRRPINRYLSAYAYFGIDGVSEYPQLFAHENVQGPLQFGRLLMRKGCEDMGILAGDIVDTMTKQLAGVLGCSLYTPSRQSEVRRDLLRVAQQNLKRLSFFGITERFSDSISLLAAMHPQLDGATRHRWMVATSTRSVLPHNVHAYNQSELQECERMFCSLDNQLYEYALELFENRLLEYGISGRRSSTS
ncbi:hypothetical protein CYMTET_49393 [Cymbomonas tetramitiformis]|uniref:Apple domain-containing protein n=1 Tax=Cymbomonas tetramitiformis TaxID=36881 RepID=A0AAE0EUK7_9CHLO|nr:hypothetical protein CYMTET_49393 [Cymbomonas tetramitiformis]|eukprot:gene4645-5688_t